MAGFQLFKKYPSLFTLLTLEFVLLVIISYQVQVSQGMSLLEKITLSIFAPVQELNQTIVGGVSEAFSENKTRAELEEENARLNQALAGLEQLHIQLEESQRENARLHEILELPNEPEWQFVAAEVIGRVNRRNDYMITINRGSRSGIKPDMGVYCPQGVVGIVWEVSYAYSKIMTINNPSSAIASILQDSRYAESYTTGFDLLTGRLKDFPNFEPIKPGDSVLTSGMDNIFPKGLHIGDIISATPDQPFQRVNVAFATDFSRLEEVVVLVPVCEDVPKKEASE